MSQPQLLLEPLSDQTKCRITSAFFSGSLYDPAQPQLWDDYFEYYEREIRRLCIGVGMSASDVGMLAARTHDDIILITQVLSGSRTQSRLTVRDELRAQHFGNNTETEVDRAMDLTVRLWLMINVRDEVSSVIIPHQNFVQWPEDMSLETLVSAHVCRRSSLQLSSRQSRLSPQFTVANMVKLCGLQLKWTESLEEHLRLDRRNKELYVFAYKTFLVQCLSSRNRGRAGPMPAPHGGSNLNDKIVPPAFLRETITTLNLLFPHWDPATQELLSGHNQEFHTIPPFAGPRRLDLGEFNYQWRDALFELYEEVYLAPADSWRQLWVDRRNPHQWYTFWIALVVLILSVVSCITSIIQAWASVKALNLQIAGG